MKEGGGAEWREGGRWCASAPTILLHHLRQAGQHMLRLPPPTHQPTTHTHMRRAPTRLKSLFLRPRLPPPTFSSITCFSVDSASTSASFRLSSLRNDSWKEREEEREKGWEDRRSHRVKRVCKAVPLVPTPSPAAGRDTCTPPPTSHLAMPCPPHHPHPNCPWPASAAAHAAAPVPDSQAGKQAGGRPGKQAGGRPGAQAGAPPPPSHPSTPTCSAVCAPSDPEPMALAWYFTKVPEGSVW